VTARKDFRYDIQFLRGIAVLLVVLFHAFESNVPKGFLGVDVFFVISGFLVTSMIVRELDTGRFTLRSFYFRRIRRIVPAVVSTLIATTVAAYWVLTSAEWDEYLRQLGACILFSANLLQSRRHGYFAPDPQGEPLRHFWSLAVEEQYYLIIPVVLMLVPSRWRLRFLFAAAGLSFLLCVIGSTHAPVLTFYNLPTRAWQLLAGALCSAPAVRQRFPMPAWAGWLALAAIPMVALTGFDSPHPRGDATLIVIATCAILLTRDDWLARNPATHAVAKIGDWSYSLYLVHWPILSFVFLAAGRRPPFLVIAAAILLSLVVAAIQYRFVELRFWRKWPIGDHRRWWQLAAMGASLIVLIIQPTFSVLAGEGRAQGAELQPRRGLPGCERQAKTGPQPDLCRTGGRPIIAVWGDSYANHLMDGILADPVLKDKLVQITSAGCAPVLGYSPLWPRNNFGDTAACISFSDEAVSYLEKGTERIVVMSSPFAGVLGDDGGKIYRNGKVISWSPQLEEGLIRGIARLRRAGKAVVIVGPTPREDYDVARCNLQVNEGLLRLGQHDCRIHAAALNPVYRQVATVLPAIARQTGSWLLMPADVLCREGTCMSMIGSRLLYRDTGHLTQFGSVYVVSHLRLNALLRRLADNPALPPPKY
jgi:peptidoglycan/LPS O-acetylase OafA/YrhL